MAEKKSRRDRWVTRAEDLNFIALTPEAEEKAKKALADAKAQKTKNTVKGDRD